MTFRVTAVLVFRDIMALMFRDIMVLIFRDITVLTFRDITVLVFMNRYMLVFDAFCVVHPTICKREIQRGPLIQSSQFEEQEQEEAKKGIKQKGNLRTKSYTPLLYLLPA